ncbi:putative reverse transcriptase domain-containing protein [Tanacetum coccineum]
MDDAAYEDYEEAKSMYEATVYDEITQAAKQNQRLGLKTENHPKPISNECIRKAVRLQFLTCPFPFFMRNTYKENAWCAGRTNTYSFTNLGSGDYMIPNKPKEVVSKPTGTLLILSQFEDELEIGDDVFVLIGKENARRESHLFATEEKQSWLFMLLKKAYYNTILILPDFSKFRDSTDASKVANCGVVQAVEHWRHYLFHKEFVLFTDHDSLRHIRTQDKVSHKHGCWLTFLEKFTFVVKHKTGVSNRAVDSLSRRSGLLVTMQVDVPGLDVICDMVAVDLYFSVVLQGVQAGEKPDFFLHNGFLFKGNQLCIPNSSLLLQIIKELHSDGHVGRDRTLQLVQASYFWPTVRKEVDRYVKRCRVCQVSKGTATNAGLYMPLPVPLQPWVNNSMEYTLRFPVGEYNKLSAKKIGPLEIVEKINSNAYRLKLPSHIRCSDVFNVKHLIPYHGDSSDDDLAMNSRTNFVYPGGNDGGPSIEERADLFLEAQDRVKKRASVKQP